MHRGSCLCGTVQYSIDGDFGTAYFCHCQRCRKAGGAAVAANVMAAAKDFAVTAGAASLKCYDGGKGVRRYFCAQCGSPILSRRDGQDGIVRVRMGTLDTPVTVPPGTHNFVGSKAVWDLIHDDLPQYQERPPA